MPDGSDRDERKRALSARKVRILEREHQALELRKLGVSYRQIGKALGVSEKEAHRDVQKGLRRLAGLNAVEAEDVRTMEVERIDALYQRAASLAHGRDPDNRMVSGAPGPDGTPRMVPLPVTHEVQLRAVAACTVLMERRATLLGLDAPPATPMMPLPGGFTIVWDLPPNHFPPAPTNVQIGPTIEVTSVPTVNGNGNGRANGNGRRKPTVDDD